jgi:hypothetical protein
MWRRLDTRPTKFARLPAQFFSQSVAGMRGESAWHKSRSGVIAVRPFAGQVRHVWRSKIAGSPSSSHLQDAARRRFAVAGMASAECVLNAHSAALRPCSKPIVCATLLISAKWLSRQEPIGEKNVVSFIVCVSVCVLFVVQSGVVLFTVPRRRNPKAKMRRTARISPVMVNMCFITMRTMRVVCCAVK